MGTALVRFFPAASSMSPSSSASTSVTALLLALVLAASNACNRVKQYTCAFSIIFFTIKFELIEVGVNATLQVGHCFFVFMDSSKQLRQKPWPFLHCMGSLSTFVQMMHSKLAIKLVSTNNDEDKTSGG